MGICFVGKVPIKDFLLNYVKAKPGKIIDQYNHVIGEHDGAIFYTIGQRHGLDIGGGLPYYVTGKNMAKNEVYVTTKLDDEKLWLDTLKLAELHWINEPPKVGKTYQVRTRHRAPLVSCHFQGDTLEMVALDEAIRAITPGQSAVFYDGDKVLGGGVVV
jgi:tRNA-specific 2-thiouridylase